MKLCYKGLADLHPWGKAGIRLPLFDWQAMCVETERNPIWVHFGAGNIFGASSPNSSRTCWRRGW